MISGIMNINKPAGLTSHDVVDLVRRAARQKKVGHAGTLDPIATGVLPLCLGHATRLAEFITAETKVYQMTCRLGLETDTQDITGEILSTRSYGEISREMIEEVLPKFRGSILQIPPMVSAKRHQGKRLYDLARQGIEIERQPVQVQVDEFQILSYTPPDIEMLVCCTKGTYVRTLCHDLGQELGCGAAMAALVRVRCGGMEVTDSVDTALLKDPESVIRYVISPDEALKHYPSVTIQDGEVGSWMNGRSLRGGGILAIQGSFNRDRIVRVKARDGRLVGLASSIFTSDQVTRLGGDLEVLKPVKVFPEPFLP